MSQIVLSQEQANAIVQATGSVTFCDPNGHVIAIIGRDSGFTEEDIREARRRAAENTPGRTTEQVLERLRSLESK